MLMLPKNSTVKGELPSRKAVEKRLNRLWSAAVRKYWERKIGYRKCAVVGCNREGNNPHHIIPKGRCKSLRWYLLNGIVLCSWHHCLGHPSAHNPTLGDPDWFKREVLLRYFTPKHLEMLEYKAHGTMKGITVSDLLLIEENLKKEIGTL